MVAEGLQGKTNHPRIAPIQHLVHIGHHTVRETRQDRPRRVVVQLDVTALLDLRQDANDVAPRARIRVIPIDIGVVDGVIGQRRDGSAGIALVKNEAIGKLAYEMGLHKWFVLSTNAETKQIRTNLKKLGCLLPIVQLNLD